MIWLVHCVFVALVAHLSQARVVELVVLVACMATALVIQPEIRHCMEHIMHQMM